MYDYYKDIDTVELLKYTVKYNYNDLPEGHFDEFDEIVVPWPTGYVFDESSPSDWIELLAKLTSNKSCIVFGRASDINGNFPEYSDWQKMLAVIQKVDAVEHSFYPNYCNLIGPLPKMVYWKAFKVRK